MTLIYAVIGVGLFLAGAALTRASLRTEVELAVREWGDRCAEDLRSEQNRRLARQDVAIARIAVGMDKALARSEFASDVIREEFERN